MVTIRDIYQWYENPPEPPSNLTPLQNSEWKEQNSSAIQNFKDKSFEGEILMDSSSGVVVIDKNKILAKSIYRGCDSTYFREYDHYISCFRNLLIVKYELLCDVSLYETIRLVYNYCDVEIEGKILKFSKDWVREYDDYCKESYDVKYYYIQLQLSKIRVKEKASPSYILSPPFSAEQLDDKFKWKPVPQVSKSSQCFIATAAYGNQDVTEVIQLREFRDNVLRNSTAGRCFICIYTFLSPPIASIIGQSNWLRSVTRRFLRKVILPMVIRETIKMEK